MISIFDYCEDLDKHFYTYTFIEIIVKATPIMPNVTSEDQNPPRLDASIVPANALLKRMAVEEQQGVCTGQTLS